MTFQKLDSIRSRPFQKKGGANGVSKKAIRYLGIVILASLICFGFVWYFFRTPEGKKEIPLPEKPNREETMEEILERLTPKESKPLTTEEKNQQEELLKQLTPQKPKPTNEKERKEIEELLKKLTPQ